MLISLDGAAAAELDRLHAAGMLRHGFERFYAAGEVAAALVPVSPAATSVNHVSLATGYPPSRTGIVSNAFHVPGTPLGERASGLATLIGTETLWQAARRQGLRVGMIAFPGRTPAPRADWGVDWMAAQARPTVLALRAADWQPLSGPVQGSGVRRSFSVPLVARLAARDSPGVVGGCEAIAVDRSDDGRTDYDTLLLPCADLSGRALPAVRVGEWIALHGQLEPAAADAGEGGYGPEAPSPVGAWAKLLALDPQTAEARLYVGPTVALGGYPERFAGVLRHAGLAWPGQPDDKSVAAAWRGEEGIDLATWFEQSQRLTHYLVDALIAGIRSGDTDLVLGYLPAIDQAGHLLLLEDPRQARYSEARRDELRQQRDRVWQMVDAELDRLLDAVDLRSTTVIVVSDHGMQPVHTMIDLNAAFERAGLLSFATPERIDPNRSQVWAVGYGGVAHVYLNLVGREPAGIVTDAEVSALRERVRALLRGLTTASGGSAPAERPIESVWLQSEASAIGLDHRHSGDLIVFATPGYVFRTDWRQGAPIVQSPASYGDHAYAGGVVSMRAILMAVGAGVEARRTGPRSVLDVAPRVAGWLGIERPRASPPLEDVP